jgi:hypothetical protein
VTLNVALLVPAATTTDDGTLRMALLLQLSTAVMFEGAG